MHQPRGTVMSRTSSRNSKPMKELARWSPGRCPRVRAVEGNVRWVMAGGDWGHGDWNEKERGEKWWGREGRWKPRWKAVVKWVVPQCRAQVKHGGLGLLKVAMTGSHCKLLNTGYSDEVNDGMISWNGKTNTQIKTTSGTPRLGENCNYSGIEERPRIGRGTPPPQAPVVWMWTLLVLNFSNTLIAESTYKLSLVLLFCVMTLLSKTRFWSSGFPRPGFRSTTALQ